MHRLSLFIGLLASVSFSFAAVTKRSVEVHKYDGPVNEGSYIVKVRDGADKAGVLSLVESLTSGDAGVLTHEWNSKFFNGFAGLSLCPCARAVPGLTGLLLS